MKQVDGMDGRFTIQPVDDNPRVTKYPLLPDI